MKTYQDLLNALGSEQSITDFILTAIMEHKGSEAYRWAQIGEEYNRQENTTIMMYRKLLYKMSGEAIPDTFTANHKLPSNFYNRFNMQENQYLLGNGANFNKATTKDKLGTRKKKFDTQLQKAGRKALTQGQAFGFFNLDHIEVFALLEFVPLYDEDDGSLKAGIRFWQIAYDKPLRATLYEMDGYTEYIKRNNESKFETYKKKSTYKINTKTTPAEGTEVTGGENYPGFPVVPLWGNQDHVCKIKAWQAKIDCYDLIESGFANDVDDASLIYWTIQNAGGMDEIDLAQFIQRMKTVHAATVDGEGAKAEAHTMDVPVQARETYLSRLEKDLCKDAMALDTEAISNGNVTATAIRASYEPLNEKTDDFEYCVIEFVNAILELAGIDDEVSFKRSTIVNQTEETNMILAAAQYLDDETVLKHLPFLSVDEVSDILKNRDQEESDRYADREEEDDVDEGSGSDEDGQETEEDGE